MFPFCSCYILNQVCFLGVDTVLTLGKCVHTVGVWNYAHSLEVCSNCGSVFTLWKGRQTCAGMWLRSRQTFCTEVEAWNIYIGHNVLWTEKFCNPNLKLLVGPEKRSFPPKFLRKVSDLLQVFNCAALKLQINMNQRGIQVFFSFN